MREKLYLHMHRLYRNRITPAYAGKTHSDFTRQIDSRDHPRVCGKNKIINTHPLEVRGSPPRMREKLALLLLLLKQCRITPAYAGKTVVIFCSCSNLPDHPRVCGKNLQRLKSLFKALGSPPRMREKHDMVLDGVNEVRITPAYAGKTLLVQSIRYNSRDHPRVCGKNKKLSDKKLARTGSPPRMREKLNHRKACEPCAGITPAYAGKTYKEREQQQRD